MVGGAPRWRNTLTEGRTQSSVVPMGASVILREVQSAPEHAGRVDGGERGDTIDSAADGDVIDSTRARGPADAGGSYGRTRRSGERFLRGRGLSSHLQAEGRASHRGINLARHVDRMTWSTG